MNMPSGRDAHRQLTNLFSAVMLILGVAMIARAVAAGGGPLSVGVVMGGLFVAAGAGRIWARRRTG